MRYASAPSGDHSLVVEGLGQFAPSGSYAHSGHQGGLGDDDDEEEEVSHSSPSQNFAHFSKKTALCILYTAVHVYVDDICSQQ